MVVIIIVCYKHVLLLFVIIFATIGKVLRYQANGEGGSEADTDVDRATDMSVKRSHRFTSSFFVKAFSCFVTQIRTGHLVCACMIFLPL